MVYFISFKLKMFVFCGNILWNTGRYSLTFIYIVGQISRHWKSPLKKCLRIQFEHRVTVVIFIFVIILFLFFWWSSLIPFSPLTFQMKYLNNLLTICVFTVDSYCSEEVYFINLLRFNAKKYINTLIWERNYKK